MEEELEILLSFRQKAVTKEKKKNSHLSNQHGERISHKVGQVMGYFL
jgi:hypothetical protein